MCVWGGDIGTYRWNLPQRSKAKFNYTWNIPVSLGWGLFFMTVKVCLQNRSPLPGLFFSFYYLLPSFYILYEFLYFYPRTSQIEVCRVVRLRYTTFVFRFQSIVFVTVFLKLRVALRFTTTSKTGWVGTSQFWSVYLIFRFLGLTFQVTVKSNDLNTFCWVKRTPFLG